jgi:hypothetical protein
VDLHDSSEVSQTSPAARVPRPAEGARSEGADASPLVQALTRALDAAVTAGRLDLVDRILAQLAALDSGAR